MWGLKHAASCLAAVIVGVGLARQTFAAEPPAISSAGVTLEECYRRALALSETLAITQESIALAQAQYRERWAAVLPRLDWFKQQFYQDGGGSAGAGNPLKVQPLSYFQLSQPLFAGGRDWKVVRVAKSIERQNQWNLQQARLNLLGDVANSFYTARSFEDALAVLVDTRKLTGERIDELKRRIRLGRSREAELLSEEALLATLDARIDDAKRSIAAARQLLFFFTQVPPEIPLSDARPDPVPFVLDQALAQSLNRPDLLASAEGVQQAGLLVDYARGAHWPTLGATGRYYTERVGPLSDVRWDVSFLLDVPLYYGGSVNAQVREARSQEIIARLTYARLKRDIDRAVRTAVDELAFSISRATAYKKALDLAERNYRVQLEEYRHGLINNLDVLKVMNDMEDVRNSWLQARINARLNDVLLRTTVGEGL